MLDPASAAACVATGQAPAHTLTPTSTNPSRRPAASGDGAEVANRAGDLGNEIHDGPRSSERGGRFVSPADALAGPDAAEPGAQSTARQLPLLASGPAVSSVSYADLLKLARGQIRRECRRYGYDWERWLADAPAWGIAEVVRRRAIRDARKRGLDLRPTDIPTDTALTAVQDVIDDWTAAPGLRPSESDFRAEQAARGERGRQAQADGSADRNQLILQLAADGVSNAEIARRVGVDRSTVGRIRRKADATAAALDLPEAATDAQHWALELWYAEVGNRGKLGPELSGRLASAADVDVEKIGRLISRCAGADVRNPAGYLRACLDDLDAQAESGGPITAPLLASAVKALGRFEFERVCWDLDGAENPAAYLQSAVKRGSELRQAGYGRLTYGESATGVGLGILRRRAPALAPPELATAAAPVIDRERAENSPLADYRRRYGRLPWEVAAEPEPVAPAAVVRGKADATADGAENCCIRLKGLRGDDSLSTSIEDLESPASPEPHKADATPQPPSPPPAARVQQEPEPPAPPEREPGQPPPTSPPVPAPCRQPLGRVLPPGVPLDDVAEVACNVAGCGCLPYRRIGAAPAPCPCHWTPAERRRYADRLNGRTAQAVAQ